MEKTSCQYYQVSIIENQRIWYLKYLNIYLKLTFLILMIIEYCFIKILLPCKLFPVHPLPALIRILIVGGY